jgi:zinc transport system permease protein
MADFIDIIKDYAFLKNALIAGLLAAFACGVTGTFVVIKKMSHITGGLSHAVLGGLGLAYFLGGNPIAGALVFAVFSAVLIGIVRLRFKQSEDTLIAALWSVGMAVGIIFMYLTPGYNIDLLSFLFGNILMVSESNLLLLAFLDSIILIVFFFFFRQFVYVCFDEEYSKLRGVSVEFVYMLLLLMIALTVVVLIQVVGIILVIALITLPAAISGQFSRSPLGMIVLSFILSIAFTYTGLFAAFQFNIPSGAAIIVTAGMVYILSFGLSGYLSGRQKSNYH